MKWPAFMLDRAKTVAWTVGIIGTFMLLALLAGVLHYYTRPEPLDAARALERYAFRDEVREAEARALATYQWLDQEKGIVQLPLDRTLELTLREWQDPVAARSGLIARVEKATELPPPPPEPENPYE